MKIVKPGDSLEVQRAIVVLYGPSGMGKSTLASTAENALLIDADRGAHRALLATGEEGRRCDVAFADTWADLARISQKDMEPYSTIIVDTYGAALDLLEFSITKGKRDLYLTEWGDMRGKSATWKKGMMLTGKDLVFVCHQGSDKPDSPDAAGQLRPHVQGTSTRNDLINGADLIGRLYPTPEGTMLTFNPSVEAVGKNCALIPDTLIRPVDEVPDAMARVIARAKEVVGG